MLVIISHLRWLKRANCLAYCSSADERPKLTSGAG